MTEARHHYLLHGLTVDSDVALAEDAPGDGGSASDEAPLRLARGADRRVPSSLPLDAFEVARVEAGDRTLCVVGRSADGWGIRYPGLLEVVLDADAEHAVAHVDPGAPEGFAPVLLSAGVLAFVLTIRGHLVLHASCVEIDGRAVALVADSGGGKSTLAALLCAGGARLVSDDITRVDPDGPDAVTVFRGSREIRLRPHGPDVMELLASHPQRVTVDDRAAIAVAVTTSATVPLAHVVLPVLRDDLTVPTLEALGAEQAVLTLLGKLRAGGIRDGRFLEAHFGALADLVERVPVSRLHLPWTRPFDRASIDAYVDVIHSLC